MQMDTTPKKVHRITLEITLPKAEPRSKAIALAVLMIQTALAFMPRAVGTMVRVVGTPKP